MNKDYKHYKQALIEHLKSQYIETVSDLWAHSKEFYEKQLIEMGGGYNSIADFIVVVINIDDQLKRFKVSIGDCK